MDIILFIEIDSVIGQFYDNLIKKIIFVIQINFIICFTLNYASMRTFNIF